MIRYDYVFHGVVLLVDGGKEQHEAPIRLLPHMISLLALSNNGAELFGKPVSSQDESGGKLVPPFEYTSPAKLLPVTQEVRASASETDAAF